MPAVGHKHCALVFLDPRTPILGRLQERLVLSPMTNFSQSPPDVSESGPAFARYIALVPQGAIITVLEQQLDEVQSLLGGLTESQALTLHPPYTWTIKQVIGHLIDCERIFGYRALRFARNDPTP